MVLKPWTILVQLFRMLTLQVAIRTLAIIQRRTTVAEPTLREAMVMPADAVEDLGPSSLLYFVDLPGLCNMTTNVCCCPKTIILISMFDM